MHDGQIFRSRRVKLGLTQEFIANRIGGITQSYVSLLENGGIYNCYYFNRYEKVLAKLERERLRELVLQYPMYTLKVFAEAWRALPRLS